MKKNSILVLSLIISVLTPVSESASEPALWRRTLSGAPTLISVSGRDIFVATSQNTLYMLTNTGRIRWTKTLESRITSISSNDKFLMVSLSNGDIFMLDLGGNRLWTNSVGTFVEYPEAIEVTGDGVFVGDAQGLVHKFDLKGNYLWNKTTDGYVLALKTFGDTLYVSSDKGVYAIRDDSMEKIFSVEDYVRSANFGDTVFSLASDDGVLYVFDDAGEKLWETRLRETIGILYSSSEGIAAGTRENNLYVFDAGGGLRWSRNIRASVMDAALNRDYVVAASTERTVQILNWRGRLKDVRTEDNPVTALTVQESSLVYGTQDGEIIYVVLTSKGRAQFLIAFILCGLAVVLALWMLMRHWRV